MFRHAAFSLALAVAAIVGLFQASSVEAQTPIQKFRQYSYDGTIQAYYGYLYCSQAEQIAAGAGFDANDTGYVLYYASYYAYYSFYYGYYGLQYEFAAYIGEAERLANIAYQYEYGAFEYIYYTLSPQQPSVNVLVEPTFYGALFMLYAEAYFGYAQDVVGF